MRLIDADKLKEHYSWWHEITPEMREQAETFDTIVNIQPTVDPVKHGRWEVVDSREPMRYGCSECKRMVWLPENYCPNCGAKMDEAGE